MLAGLLAHSGWAVNGDLLPPTPANPRGFFESSAVNTLNDDLLEPHLARSAVPVARRHAWLAALPAPLDLTPSPAVRTRIAETVPPSPFVVKDPRLTMTLPAWVDALDGVALIAIVRHPAAVVDSLLREVARDVEYYEGLALDAERAFVVWQCLADHLIAHAEAHDITVLVHEELVSDGIRSALGRLATAVGGGIDSGFVERGLRRSTPDRALPGDVAERHAALLDLAVR